MPHIYCEKCRAPQQSDEKACLKCGTPFGGNTLILVLGLVLALGGPLLVSVIGKPSAGPTDRAIFQALFYWILPVLVGTLCLYDHNGKRVSMYLYGGGALIALGVFLLNR